jgi:hypothetical protein
MSGGGQNLKVLDGLTFGRLTVLRRSKRKSDKCGNALWDCRCICGGSRSEFMVRGSLLLNGMTQSCGCLRAERSREHNRLRGERNRVGEQA